MTGMPGCPQCGGSGVLLDPDPMVPARPCACAKSHTQSRGLSIPMRYRNATFEGFWDWWKMEHGKDRALPHVKQALVELEADVHTHGLREDLRSGLELILHKCGVKMQAGELIYKDLKPAHEPQGYRPFVAWAKHGREHADVWWLDGPPGSGRSSLAAAALRTWCERTGQEGRFVSVRTLSQELKDTYYDTLSWKNVDFTSERDRIAPLMAVPCLVLDDLDRIDSDIRVVRAMGQLLDHRYAEERPTLITASRWAGTLRKLPPESYPLLRLEDESLLSRLEQARRVELRPVLERLMESVRG